MSRVEVAEDRDDFKISSIEEAVELEDNDHSGCGFLAACMGGYGDA